jgi:hypothetical protein
MALTSCIECGSEVSDKAATCPRCGVANPGGKERKGRLVVRRLWGFSAAIVGIEIYVDRVAIGSVKNGGEIEASVTAGRREITFGLPLFGIKQDVSEIGRQGGGGDPSPVSAPALMRELGNSPRGVSEGGA